MGWKEFVADIVGSVAWPAVVLLVLLMLRKPIAESLRDRTIASLKVGPSGVEVTTVERALREASSAVAAAVPDAPAVPEQSPERAMLLALLEISPSAAVMEAFRLLELELRDLTRDVDSRRPPSVRQLAEIAIREYWLSPAVAEAVNDLARVRNAVVHGVDYVDTQQALQFVNLATSLLIPLRGHPPRR